MLVSLQCRIGFSSARVKTRPIMHARVLYIINRTSDESKGYLIARLLLSKYRGSAASESGVHNREWRDDIG